jgi:hypothetical protein
MSCAEFARSFRSLFSGDQIFIFSGEECSTEAKQSTENGTHDSLKYHGEDFRVFRETERFYYGQIFIMVLPILRSIWCINFGGDFN